jgi:DNA-binding SARP family transcriptional activator
MRTLRICLFGSVRVSHDGQLPTRHVTRSVQSLLAYLLLHRQRLHPREVLASVFWSEQSEERARSCLSTALWRLRGVLEANGVPKGTYLVTNPLGEIGFNRTSDHWLDVAAFEAEVNRVLAKSVQALAADDAGDLREALSLYTGELLEGFYDDWALRERERLHVLQLKGLIHLMRYWKGRGDYDEALACGQRILDQDPLREEIHREVMRIYLESGERDKAIRQYNACRRVLKEELGIAPMEETQRLHAEIIGSHAAHGNVPSGEGRASVPPPGRSPSTENQVCPSPPRVQTGVSAQPGSDHLGGDGHGLQQAIERLEVVVEAFERSREELQRAVRLLESLTKSPDRR